MLEKPFSKKLQMLTTGVCALLVVTLMSSSMVQASAEKVLPSTEQASTDSTVSSNACITVNGIVICFSQTPSVS